MTAPDTPETLTSETLTPETPGQQARPLSQLPLLAVNFVGTMGFSIVLPFLVFLVTRWGGNAVIFGHIGATYSTFQLFGAPILGRWSDRIGRRKVLLLNQLGTLASWLIFLGAFFVPVTAIASADGGLLGSFTLTVPLLVLFLAHAVDALTGGNVSVANAYLADITNERTRAKNFGRMALAGNLGFVVGPALTGLLAGTVYGAILPVLAAIAVSVLAVFLIVFGLKETNPCALHYMPGPRSMRRVFGQEQKDCIERPQMLSFAQILKLGDVPRLLAINFLVMLGFSFSISAFSCMPSRA